MSLNATAQFNKKTMEKDQLDSTRWIAITNTLSRKQNYYKKEAFYIFCVKRCVNCCQFIKLFLIIFKGFL